VNDQLPPPAAVLIGAAVAAALTAFLLGHGLWWAALPLGAALGLWLGRWWLLPLAAASGLVGWGAPLLVLALSAPVGGAAAVVGAVLGAPPAASGAVALILTLLIGMLLALVGAWLGVAARRLFRPPQET
jgi:hypothetical protein